MIGKMVPRQFQHLLPLPLRHHLHPRPVAPTIVDGVVEKNVPEIVIGIETVIAIATVRETGKEIATVSGTGIEIAGMLVIPTAPANLLGMPQPAYGTASAEGYLLAMQKMEDR